MLILDEMAWPSITPFYEALRKSLMLVHSERRPGGKLPFWAVFRIEFRLTAPVV